MATILPPPEDCVVRELIDRRAAERPDRPFVLFEDGAVWTYAELKARVQGWAAGLQRLGVRQGDFVLSWQANSPEALLTYLGLNYLGAVCVAINTAYRGAVLEHVIRKSGARLMVADGRLLDRLKGIELNALSGVVSLGKPASVRAGLTLISEKALREAAGPPAPPERPIEPWDTHLVLYTSGATGPSKGVLCSYLQSWSTKTGFRHHGPGDRHLVPLPLFHTTGAGTTYYALAHGGSIALVDGFDTARFWETVDRFQITTVGLLGVMAQFLLKQPESPADRAHSLKTCLVVPIDPDTPRFAERFGVEVYTIFNMTEISVPLFAGPNPDQPGICGRVREGYEVRLVDAHDFEVGEGEAGELVLRTDMPWAICSGYLGDPEATARTWRNGWFHTGDLFRRDADGNYFFVDRLKDAVRRRGENISSFEVESAVAAHPDVREAAVIGVPSPLGEEEVMAVIAPAPGRTVDPSELIEFLRPRLAPFMIPRYVRIMDALPKTPTQKVLKVELKAQGLTDDAWDREAAGIKVARDKLGARSDG
jgi:crotonobetaine/carnitine-CoA ligase